MQGVKESFDGGAGDVMEATRAGASRQQESADKAATKTPENPNQIPKNPLRLLSLPHGPPNPFSPSSCFGMSGCVLAGGIAGSRVWGNRGLKGYDAPRRGLGSFGIIQPTCPTPRPSVLPSKTSLSSTTAPPLTQPASLPPPPLTIMWVVGQSITCLQMCFVKCKAATCTRRVQVFESPFCERLVAGDHAQRLQFIWRSAGSGGPGACRTTLSGMNLVRRQGRRNDSIEHAYIACLLHVQRPRRGECRK